MPGSTIGSQKDVRSRPGLGCGLSNLNSTRPGPRCRFRVSTEVFSLVGLGRFIAASAGGGAPPSSTMVGVPSPGVGGGCGSYWRGVGAR
jgi:hypothetical protein